MKDSKIEWTKHTFNPIRGCVRISPGCRRCYAEAMSGRNPAQLGIWGPFGTRPTAGESYWRQLARWNAEAALAGERAPVFCASLADLGEGEPGVERAPYEERMAAALEVGTDDAVSEVDAWAALFESRDGPRATHLLVLERLAAETASLPWLPLLILTKRPWNLLRWAERRGAWPATWALGVTIESAHQLGRWHEAVKIPAPMRFWSVEPQVGPLRPATHLLVYEDAADGQWRPRQDAAAQECRRRRLLPDWIIQGGESGGGARPLHPGWARELRDMAAAAGVPYLFKQWGESEPMSPALTYMEGVDGARNGEQSDRAHWREFSAGVLVIQADGRVEVPKAPFEAWWQQQEPEWQADEEVVDAWDVPDAWPAETAALAREGGVPWAMHRVGKKVAGRALDHVEHNGRPAFLTDREPIRGAA